MKGRYFCRFSCLNEAGVSGTIAWPPQCVAQISVIWGLSVRLTCRFRFRPNFEKRRAPQCHPRLFVSHRDHLSQRQLHDLWQHHFLDRLFVISYLHLPLTASHGLVYQPRVELDVPSQSRSPSDRRGSSRNNAADIQNADLYLRVKYRSRLLWTDASETDTKIPLLNQAIRIFARLEAQVRTRFRFA